MFFGWSRRIVGFSKLGNVDQFVLRKWLLGLTAKPFDDLAEIWQREVDMYSTVEDCVKIVIGNKVDKAEHRAVSREEGMAFARDNGCLFLECSAKTRVSVQEAFEELVRGVLETPSLLAETAAGDGRVRLKQYQAQKGACAC